LVASIIANATRTWVRAASGSSSASSHARRSGDRDQLAPARHAVMEQHSLDALLPFTVLIDQRVPQPHLGAQLEHVLGRDP